MDAKTTAKFLQTQLNRYVKLTGLAPLGVDGVIGKGTATATKMALNEILKLSAPYLDGGAAAWRDWYQFAWGYMNTVDMNNPTTVVNQAYPIADLLQKFGDFNGSPILKDAATPTTTTTTRPTTRPTVSTVSTVSTLPGGGGGGGIAASITSSLGGMSKMTMILLGVAVVGIGYYVTKKKAK